MARFPRLIIPAAVYHITARGNYRQEVFFSDQTAASTSTCLPGVHPSTD
jgi:REP element-mobilizing transposase RayT